MFDLTMCVHLKVELSLPVLMCMVSVLIVYLLHTYNYKDFALLCRDGAYIYSSHTAAARLSQSHWPGQNSGQLLPVVHDFAFLLASLIGQKL